MQIAQEGITQEQTEIQPFNLDTMSGVFPGTRTPVYQRVRLTPPDTTDASEYYWYEVRWHQQPTAITLVPFRTGSGGSDTDTPLLSLHPTQSEDVFNLLTTRLHDLGWRIHCCGSCAAWQPLETVHEDALPVGICTWDHDDAEYADQAKPDWHTPVEQCNEMRRQSCMALGCHHWQEKAVVPHIEKQSTPALASEAQGDDTSNAATSAHHITSDQPSRGLFARLRALFTPQPPEPAHRTVPTLAERSGVGAGTEPCLACQGRIANLGAFPLETPEGDKQTISIWRCRICHTLYLNDWIDRWERLDSLETAETYYRIAPAEANWAIELIAQSQNREHPQHLAEQQYAEQQSIEQQKLFALITDLEPLSHQIKQGR